MSGDETTEGGGPVWVVLVQDGREDSRATEIEPPAAGRVFHMDYLCKAAKKEFSRRLEHVDAADLVVSTTRDGDPVAEDADVARLSPQGKTTKMPLYIRAPAPSQGEDPPSCRLNGAARILAAWLGWGRCVCVGHAKKAVHVCFSCIVYV
jgi:hypothetical protein